jgi:hypothetical protein
MPLAHIRHIRLPQHEHSMHDHNMTTACNICSQAQTAASATAASSRASQHEPGNSATRALPALLYHVRSLCPATSPLTPTFTVVISAANLPNSSPWPTHSAARIMHARMHWFVLHASPALSKQTHYFVMTIATMLVMQPRLHHSAVKGTEPLHARLPCCCSWQV